MKGTFLAIALHFALACCLYATAIPEDNPIARANYPNQNAFICIYQSGAEIALNGRTHFLQGTANVDQYGAVELIEGPTGSAVAILPDGSADLSLAGIQYTFQPE